MSGRRPSRVDNAKAAGDHDAAIVMENRTSQIGSDVPAVVGGEPVRPAGPPDWPPRYPQIEQALRRAYETGDWGRYFGANVDQLARRLADYHEVASVQLCCSGTAAVELALRAAKVGPGDEVILAGYDFKGNFLNVLALGATPVLVDITPECATLDCARLGSAVTTRTKVVLATHVHGGAVCMSRVVEFARFQHLRVIEDACQMPGAYVEGRRAGTWGDLGVLSFGGSKLLTAGRGGALITNDPELGQRVRLLCERGNHAFPLSELQAAVLLPQLDRLDADNARRRASVLELAEQLKNVSGLRPFACNLENTVPGYYKVGFWYDTSHFAGLSRGAFVAAMRAEGVAVDAGFRSLHRSHSRRRYRTVGDLVVASAADAAIVVLHHPVLLGASSDIAEIARAATRIQIHASAVREAVDHAAPVRHLPDAHVHGD
jgi:dTDP-4-amino-4,6-dideoxygalactose transaminase